MEINRIYQFRVVFETESVRKASELLKISPGALSKSLKVLESEVGKDLFLPKGRNIVPTDFARGFYHRSTPLIQAYETFVRAPITQDECAPITITTWEVFSSYFIGYLAEHDLEGRKLRVIERTPHHLENALLKGEAEIGLTYAPIPHKELNIMRIASIRYGVFAKKGCFSGLPLEKIPFAVPITIFPSSPTGVNTLDNWPEDVNRSVAYEFELLETALETCRRGLNAIFCPTFVANLHNATASAKLAEISFSRKIPRVCREVYLVTRDSRTEDNIIKKIAKSLRLACKT